MDNFHLFYEIVAFVYYYDVLKIICINNIMNTFKFKKTYYTNILCECTYSLHGIFYLLSIK